ncbi:phosphoethanolamine transferase [Mannheimia varigena]|uniref:phosphoethanolamine transferase n=1 Tax=Mannheimia varigena TaxID=85404 RepID=UPI0003E31916|nr:phosphoethanolamine transferase [Mannheimia varigena]AHG77798.1 transmembrane protein (N-terminal) [Mannheimia varigena USDA-ARS-USMARC-1312]
MRKKQIFGIIIALLLAIIASYLMLIGSGFFPTPTLFEILFGVFLIIILASSRWTYYALLLPISIAYAFYTPIGLNFGKPTYEYIASVFATDMMESKEFLSQLSILHIFAGIVIVLAVIFFKKITNTYQIHFLKNKTFVIVASLLMLVQLAPFKFFQEFVSSGTKVAKELEQLNNLTLESQWGESKLGENAKYDDYVLIMGESARKDYHHAYGYPIPNTPFMSSANGTLVDGLTSGGTNTIASLRLMLTKPDTEKWEANYGLTLVDLIKSAGIKTYWISNQGYLGNYDTPISSIGNKSDVKIFTKSGSSLNTNVSDFELLPHFGQVIEEPTQGKRFIFLHLYGSHPITCDRLIDYPKIFDDGKLPKRYFNVNCYISSIKKTDELLKRVYDLLVKNYETNQRSFSMIYLSDHGLSHEISKDNIVIQNGKDRSKLHYDIPLFKISSDDIKRNMYKTFKSGLNFTNGIANWIGIENPLLDKELDLFNNKYDPSDYGLKKMIEADGSIDDPAVLIPKSHLYKSTK